MVDMPRVLVYDRLDQYLCDIDPQQVLEMPYTEEVNGEHSLTIRTTQKLEKTNRLLLKDGTGEWHEYVVLGIDDTHAESEYYCVWSLEYDLSATFINGPYDCGVVPGHASVPQLPRRAMEVSLGDTTRWVIGTITVTTMAAASFYRRSGWEGLQTVLERWGGELHATIGVDSTGVISRAVDLLAHEGTEEPTRRFDYGHDVTGITRTISDDVWPCRIVPLGKSSETEAGGYTRRPSIESVNGGILWLQDDSAVPLVRVMNPQGEWEYPTSIIKNDTYEDPAALKEWALENISDYTRPKVSYSATVAQFARAGLNPHGVRLGDEIIVVDRDFRDEGLRISARVLKIKGDLLDASKTQLTIGNALPTLGGQLKGIASQVDTVAEEIARTTDWETTAGYLSNLLGRLNTEANMTGGYTYITQGEGLRTYDTPVSDPLVGTEASKVVEVKGGNIRIADSRTSGGDWDWRTLLVSGHIASELITAANITAGYIGNAAGSGYWDLDSGVMYRGSEMELLLSVASLAVSRGYAYSSNAMSSSPGSVYLICFTCSEQLTSNQFVRLWNPSNSTNVSTWATPRKISDFGDGTYRYAAVVEHLDGVVATSNARFYISWSGGTAPGSYTITNARVYLYPIESPGSIVFESTGDNGRDVIRTVVAGGRVSTIIDGNETSMTPGLLLLSSLSGDAELKMVDDYRGVRYDASTDRLLVGNTEQFSGTTANPLKGNLLFDLANNALDVNTEIGAYQLRSHSTLSDWFTVSTSNASVSASSLEEWGPLRKFSLTLSLVNSVSLNTSSGSWLGSITIGTFAAAYRPPNYKVFHGYAPSGSSQYVTEFSFYVYNGQLRLFHIVQQPRTSSTGMSWQSGATIYLNDIY